MAYRICDMCCIRPTLYTVTATRGGRREVMELYDQDDARVRGREPSSLFASNAGCRQPASSR